MKKTGFFLLALLVCATSFAGTELVERGSFAASGEEAAFTIPLRKGSQIVSKSLYASVETNQNLVIYRPYKITETTAGTGGRTTAFIKGATNTLSGVTAGDFLLFKNESSGAYSIREISSYIGWTEGRNYAFAVSSIAYAIGDTVHIILASDTLSIPITTDSSSIQYEDIFTGFVSQLVHLQMDAGSGSQTVFSGTYDVER